MAFLKIFYRRHFDMWKRHVCVNKKIYLAVSGFWYDLLGHSNGTEPLLMSLGTAVLFLV